MRIASAVAAGSAFLAVLLAASGAALAGDLLLVDANSIKRVDVEKGTAAALSEKWEGTELAAYCNGSLYALQGATLYRVNLKDGSREAVPGKFEGLNAMCAGPDALFVSDRSKIFKVNPADGTKKPVVAETWAIDHIAWVGGSLMVFQHGQLFRVQPDGGTFKRAGTETWEETACACGSDRRLYAIQKGSLYEIDPVNGECECLATDYKGASLMAFYDGFLYVIQGETLYKVNPKDQKYVEVGKEWQDVRVLVTVPAAGK